MQQGAILAVLCQVDLCQELQSISGNIRLVSVFNFVFELNELFCFLIILLQKIKFSNIYIINSSPDRYIQFVNQLHRSTIITHRRIQLSQLFLSLSNSIPESYAVIICSGSCVVPVGKPLLYEVNTFFIFTGMIKHFT